MAGLFNSDGWSKLQEFVRPPGSPSGSRPQFVLPESFTQLNDHVYEVCKPPHGKRPSVEIVFFHGLQLEYIDELHINTWLSRGKTALWLTWLLEKHADARILTVSYDAFPDKTGIRGMADSFVTCENLITCLILSREAAIGQAGCPVVLVGHCLGGLIMKEILVEVLSNLPLSPERQKVALENFLNNVKAVFYYSTPHYGSELPSITRNLPKAPLFANTALLNEEVQRKNQKFRFIRQQYGWISAGIGESRIVDLGGYKNLVVAEASARYDIDINQFYTVDANHFDVCRPESRISAAFTRLAEVIRTVVEEDECQLQRSLEGALVAIRVAMANEGGHDVYVKIADAPGMHEVLFNALTSDGKPLLQMHALQALQILAEKGGCGIVAKISDIPGLLESLVHVLGRVDLPFPTRHASGALIAMANAGGHGVCVKIADTPGMLEVLSTALTRDETPVLNQHALRALDILAKKGGHKIATKMSHIPGLLENLVHVLGRVDLPFPPRYISGPLVAMANEGDHDVCVTIANTPGMLEVLCSALRGYGTPVLKQHALQTLEILAKKGGNGIAVKMSHISRLLERVVHVLGRANLPFPPELASGLLVAMANEGGHDVCVTIADTPGMLEVLCSALTRDGTPVLNQHSLQALQILAKKGGSEIAVKISHISGLLESLVHVLERIDLPFPPKYASKLLVAIANEGNDDVCVTIADTPGMLEVLCSALTRDGAPVLNRHAAQALQILAKKGGSGIGVKISDLSVCIGEG